MLTPYYVWDCPCESDKGDWELIGVYESIYKALYIASSICLIDTNKGMTIDEMEEIAKSQDLVCGYTPSSEWVDGNAVPEYDVRITTVKF